MFKLTSVLLACVTAVLVVQDADQKAQKGPQPPKVGELAPTFRLNDHMAQAVSVGGKSDRWTVVAFFPKAMTPG